MKRLFLGLLIFHLVLFQLASTATARAILGVVRSKENAREWAGIEQRLKASGIAYRVIELEKVQEAADLEGTEVIFLPNIETLTANQVSALEGWISRGGRAIASGDFGGRSPAGVRQTLRSLLGAYWAFPLPQSSVVKAQQACQSENTATAVQVCAPWVPQEASVSPVPGGVLIPVGAGSQTAATWNIGNSSAAVVASPRATFFGWKWGSDATAPPEFDTAWLRAALTRYGLNLPDVATPAPIPIRATPQQESSGDKPPRATGEKSPLPSALPILPVPSTLPPAPGDSSPPPPPPKT